MKGQPDAKWKSKVKVSNRSLVAHVLTFFYLFPPNLTLSNTHLYKHLKY